jgi:type I protein arginine methyltransferase
MNGYFDGYGNLSLQRFMVADQRRTNAFAAGIAEAVKQGDVVIDVGTGTGILAMLAARAGASRVHAVDQARVSKLAEELVEANDLSDIVRVHHGAASSLEVDGCVDFIVSEWLGNFALAEGMLKDVLEVRDRFLKPGGRMLPSFVDVMLAPVEDSVLYDEDGPGFWREEIHGLDFSSLEKAELAQLRTARMKVDDSTRLAKGESLVGIDIAQMKEGDQFKQGLVNLEITKDGVVNGFVGWFAARLSPHVLLDTGPGFPWTHWSQTYMPFPARPVSEGETLVVEYDIQPSPECSGSVVLTLCIDGRSYDFSIN